MPVLKIKKNGQWVEVWGATSGGSGGGDAAIVSDITLRADSWTGTSSPYSQVVTARGADATSKIDIQPTPEQAEQLKREGASLMAVNDGGVITVYAINNRPTSDYIMSVFITDCVVV